MSKLLKSKFLLGALVATVMLVGVVAVNAKTSNAASCSITTTLKLGSKGAQVACLQAALDNGLKADGSFGPKTKAEVVAFQSAHGLTADGVFGPKSRAVWMGSVGVGYPAGCVSGTGFSATTGMPCSSTMMTTTYPAGCTSSTGYSPTTGASCSTGVVVGNPTGPLTVSLAADNPAAGYIIANEAAADLLHFTVTGTGTLNSITLHRTGISDQNTLVNVYLFHDNTRLTDGYSFNNTGDLTMNSLGIAVNGSLTISVKADLASSAILANSSTLGITLTSFTPAGGTATMANVAGNTMYTGTGSLATVYVNANTVSAASVNAGTSAYTVWSAPIQVNTRSVTLKGANFRMVGSAPANALGNINLFVDGVQAGTAASLGTITGSNYAMFDFTANPITLTTGTHTVDVRADVVNGASYDVTVSLQQSSDLVLYDPQIGVNIAPLGVSGATFSSNTAGKISISQGSASVTVDPTFSALTNITGGATNTVIGRFKVHGYGEDVKVQNLLVKPVVTGGGNASSDGHYTQLQNVAVFFNGSQVGSSANYDGTHALNFSLGSQMIVPAGTDSYIEIRADLQNDNSINYTSGQVSVNLNPTSGQLTTNGQGQTSHQTFAFPASESDGTILTIQTGLLAVSKDSGYASQNVNPNTDNTVIGSYILQNQSSSEGVRVTSLSIGLYNGTGTALDNTTTTPHLNNFSNLRTSESSGSGANPIQPSASNTFSVNFTLAPGATKTLQVLATTGSATSGSFETKLAITSIGVSSNVSLLQNGTGTAVTGQTLTLAVGSISNTTGASLLTGNATTSQQFVPASGGASDATLATFKLNATSGSATVSEMKVTVNSQDFSAVYHSGTLTGGAARAFTTVGNTNGFAKGDVVQLVGTTTVVGTVTAVSPNVTADTATVTVWLPVTATLVADSATQGIIRVVPSTVTNIRIGNVNASPVNGVADLTNLNLVVPNGGSGLSVPVYVSYAPVGTNGIQSGATSRVAIEYIKYTSGNTTTTLYSGVSSTSQGLGCASSCLTPVSAPTMKLVGSTPTLAVLPSSSVANGSLSPGLEEVGDVTVVATKGAIVLKALPINVGLNKDQLTTTGSNAVVVKDASGNLVATTNPVFSSGTGGGTTMIYFGSTGYEIDTTQTFKIFVNIDSTNFNGSGTPVAHAASATFGLDASYTSATQGLIWVDLAGSAAAATGTDVAASTTYDTADSYTTVGNETTTSNKYLDAGNTTATPGFFFSYPTTTVSVSS